MWVMPYKPSDIPYPDLFRSIKCSEKETLLYLVSILPFLFYVPSKPIGIPAANTR